MEMTNLGACEWFVWDLRRSHLLDAAKLDEVVGQFITQKPEAEPPALAEYLVDQGLLTPFQSERLLQGKSQDLVLGPFVLIAALGSGSMGTVYRATSKKNKGFFAVKVLPRRSMWNARMARRLVSAFEKFKHPAVVPFVDVGTAGAMHYLAWPLVEGETLENLVKREGKLDPDRAARFILQTAEGLEICHKNSLVHGMIKPSNLMVGPDEQVRILDFGIASLLAQDEGESLVDTRSTANVLTSGLDCVSPESIVDPSNRSPAGDQYSLGCVLYFCLAGTYPFAEATAAEKIYAHQMKQPTPIGDVNPKVSESLAAIVDRLMQKAPEARYPSLTELIAALGPLDKPAEAPVAPAPKASTENDATTVDFQLPGKPEPVTEIPSSAPTVPLEEIDWPVGAPSPDTDGLPLDAPEPLAVETPIRAAERESSPPVAERELPPPIPAPHVPVAPAPIPQPALEIAPPAVPVAQVTASPPISEPAPAQAAGRHSAPTDYSLFDIPGVENPLEEKLAEMRKSWVFPLPELDAKLKALMHPAAPGVNAPSELPAAPRVPPVVSPAPKPAPPAAPPAPKPALPPRVEQYSPPSPAARPPEPAPAAVVPPPPPPRSEPPLVPVFQPVEEPPVLTPAPFPSQQATSRPEMQPVWLMVGGLIVFVLIFFLGFALFPH